MQVGKNVPRTNSKVFYNQLPDELADELAIAKQLGVKPISVADQGFEAVANSGTIKWAVTQSGELKIIPGLRGIVWVPKWDFIAVQPYNSSVFSFCAWQETCFVQAAG
jgi:hypothetical protein